MHDQRHTSATTSLSMTQITYYLYEKHCAAMVQVQNAWYYYHGACSKNMQLPWCMPYNILPPWNMPKQQGFIMVNV